MRNEKGFTLIEMLIVLLIISVLILVTIPNVTKHFQTIDDKGCSAYIAMVQSQVEAYKIDHQKFPTVKELIDGEYLPETQVEKIETVDGQNNKTVEKKLKCPNGEPLEITDKGKVQIEKPPKPPSS